MSEERGAGGSPSLAELAEAVGGRVLGDAEIRISGIRTLASARPRDLSFLHKASLADEARASEAGALMVPASLAFTESDFGRPLVEVEDGPLALAQLIGLFHPRRRVAAPGVHPTAVVEEGCEIDPSVAIGPYAVIGGGSRIGAETEIGAHCVVGARCRIGAQTRLHPHAVLYEQTVVGDGVEVHSGAVLGADGFGYATAAGAHHKIPQVGVAELEDGVEIGANSTVDRALLEVTRVGAGSKIDNLVHVGHNVTTGRGCILCGQSGIAGSTSLGDFVVLGGQSGVVDHRQLTHQVQVAAKSAVFSDIETSQQVGGIPAIPLGAYRRQAVAAGRLPDLVRRLRRLERALEKLEAERRESDAEPEAS